MDQEKRVLIAFVLSFALLLLWRQFAVKLPPPPTKTASETAGQSASPNRTVPSQQSKPSPPAAPSESAPVPLRVEKGEKPQEIVVEGDVYKVTLSNQGAVVQSWVLKRYKDAKGDPLDVVDPQACQQLGFPMSLGLADASLSSKLNSAVFAMTPLIPSVKAPATVEFTYSDGTIQARKTFTFGPGYEAKVEVSVFDGRHDLPVEVQWPGGFGDQSLPVSFRDATSKTVYGAPGNWNTVAQTKVKGESSIPGPLEAAGLEDRFFVSIFLPESPDEAFRFTRQVWNPPDWKEKEPPRPLEAMLGTPLPQPLKFRLFVAPKELDVLHAERPPLDGLVDFGWFSPVVKPLFLALRYINEHWTHNWGWAIVVLTILLNMLTFPLKIKSIRSAQEMQKIAPVVKGIQDKYKQYKFNDPRKQRMNEEIMKLYKEHGVNPLGGCLPMVVQLPILYGFYRLLDLSIELRHAPWFGWIKDLSMPDPLYVLPVIIVVTTFVLQKMTPTATVDPAQQRMMTIMPLMFGFIFFKLASGVVLYYLAANLVGIGQQLLINRMTSVAPQSPPGNKPPSGTPRINSRKPVGVNP